MRDIQTFECFILRTPSTFLAHIHANDKPTLNQNIYETTSLDNKKQSTQRRIYQVLQV